MTRCAKITLTDAAQLVEQPFSSQEGSTSYRAAADLKKTHGAANLKLGKVNKMMGLYAAQSQGEIP